jgi:hypothetical protein
MKQALWEVLASCAKVCENMRTSLFGTLSL